MIRLLAHPFPSSPVTQLVSLSQSSCVSPTLWCRLSSLLAGDGGGGGRGAKYEREKAWPSVYYLIPETLFFALFMWKHMRSFITTTIDKRKKLLHFWLYFIFNLFYPGNQSTHRYVLPILNSLLKLTNNSSVRHVLNHVFIIYFSVCAHQPHLTCLNPFKTETLRMSVIYGS